MINKMSSSSSEERKDPKLLAEIAFDQDMMSMIKHDPDKDCNIQESRHMNRNGSHRTGGTEPSSALNAAGITASSGGNTGEHGIQA